MNRKLLAEFLGTAGLLIIVVDSGIMGETLEHGNTAIAKGPGCLLRKLTQFFE